VIRKLVTSVVGLGLVAGLAFTGAGVSGALADSGTPYTPYSFEHTPMGPDQAVMVVTEPGVEFGGGSKLAVQPGSTGNTDTRGDWLYCSSSKDKTCDPTNPALDLLALTVLPYCAKTTSQICLESLELAPAGGDFSEAQFLGNSQGMTIPGDASQNLFEGSTPSLFKAANVPNRGGTNNYAVSIHFSENFNHSTGKYETSSMIADVVPYKEVSGNYTAAYFDATAKPRDAIKGTNGVTECAYINDGSCGQRQDFTAGTKVRLKFRFPTSMGGWFSGRMKSPEIAINKISDTVNEAVVSAEPVDVPQLAYVKNQSDITIEKTWNVGRGGIPTGQFWGVTAGGPGGEDSFKWVDLFRKPLNDTAEGTVSYWNLMTTNSGSGNSCLSDTSKVLGVVTTNAMTYDVAAPSFKDGFLNYNVSGLHYLPGGKDLALGTYDLVMRSDTARCLYGFTNAPISATISVIGGETDNVATTVVNEANGWLKLAAYGFTFSDKTLQVKMTQAKASAGSTRSSITCVKGKVTKKVTGSKCPAGYKKK